MAAYRSRDTGPEMAVRRALHARGLRYRVHWPLPFDRRRRADVAFTRARVAVFVDGCFWHGCREHFRAPQANAAWWANKIGRNRERDADTTRRLEADGWVVVRVWEHEDPQVVADRVEALVRSRSGL
jgi:DNA mismatch endonuclease, patch repair protein